MLVSSGNEPVRVQCAFIDTPEIEELTEFIGSQQGYPDAMHLPEYIDDSESGIFEVDLKKRDPMFDDAARLVVQHQQGSTSLIQRKLSIGYNRAGRIIDQLEAAGIVGSFEGSKARDVLCSDMIALEQILKSLE
jgi:S-DNA-T family DNA segregation ATPase FtsK/SpoIIIE